MNEMLTERPPHSREEIANNVFDGYFLIFST